MKLRGAGLLTGAAGFSLGEMLTTMSILAILLVIQVRISSTNELALPDFVLRRLESRHASQPPRARRHGPRV